MQPFFKRWQYRGREEEIFREGLGSHGYAETLTTFPLRAGSPGAAAVVAGAAVAAAAAGA